MGQGFGGIQKASQELEARRSGGGGGGNYINYFKLGPGEETVVRFLEQDDDVHWAYIHEIPVENRSWGRDFPCCDQKKDGTPCPGCDADLPRKVKGYINVIWEDAPNFKRDEQGKMVKDSTGAPVVLGTQPAVAMWSSGIRLFEELGEINANFKGLSSRRFKVKRTGTGFDTKYRIAPEDVDSGPQEFSEAEKKLADKKFDLSPFVKVPTFEEFEEELHGKKQGGGGGGQQAPQQRQNPFMRR